MDEAQIAAMIQQILNGGDPFMDDYDMNAMPWIGGSEKNDPGTLEAQNSQLTAVGKGSSRFMDPAFILGLGSSLGGASPESFAPVTRYQPVQAAGRQQLQQWSQSSDPFQVLVATLVGQGFGPGAIQQQVQAILSDPNHEDYASIRPFVPNATATDKLTGRVSIDTETPDWNYVTSAITGLSDAIGKDVGEWDGVTLDETGAPAVAVQEDSEMTKALQEAGFTSNPYETYDPSLFAGEGDIAQEQQWESNNQDQMFLAQDAQYLYEQARKKAADAASRYQNVRDNPSTMGDESLQRYLDTRVGEGQGGGASGWLDRNIGNPLESLGQNLGRLRPGMGQIAEGEDGGSIPYPTIRMADRPQAQQGPDPRVKEEATARAMMKSLQGSMEKDVQQRMYSANTDRRRAYSQNQRQKAERHDAARSAGIGQRRAGERQQLVEFLMAAGHSPFADQNRARQANIWGG